MSLKRPFVPKSDVKQWFTNTTTGQNEHISLTSVKPTGKKKLPVPEITLKKKTLLKLLSSTILNSLSLPWCPDRAISPSRFFAVSKIKISLKSRSFASAFRSFAFSLFRSLAVSLFRTFALSLFRTFVVSLFRCFALSQFRTFVVSHFRGFVVSHFRCFPPPLPSAPLASLYHVCCALVQRCFNVFLTSSTLVNIESAMGLCCVFLANIA